MIQRKQSLFLLAVAIIAIVQFFLPFQTYSLYRYTMPHTYYHIDELTWQAGFSKSSVSLIIIQKNLAQGDR